MSKVVQLAGALAAVTLTSVTAANAHSPHDVVHILRDHGYTEIEFVDPSRRITWQTPARTASAFTFTSTTTAR